MKNLLAVFLLFVCVSCSRDLTVTPQATVHNYVLEFNDVCDPECDPFPFVGLMYRDDHFLACGVLIRDEIVLTAAHVAFAQPNRIEIAGRSYEIEKMAFAPGALPDLKVDLALLLLKEKVDCSNITLPLIPQANILIKYAPLTVIGGSWDIKHSSKHGMFQYSGIFIDDLEMIIWFPAFTSIAPGDSGGAVMRTGTNLLVGITSHFYVEGTQGLPVENCAQRLDTHWQWISQTCDDLSSFHK